MWWIRIAFTSVFTSASSLFFQTSHNIKFYFLQSDFRFRLINLYVNRTKIWWVFGIRRTIVITVVREFHELLNLNFWFAKILSFNISLWCWILSWSSRILGFLIWSQWPCVNRKWRFYLILFLLSFFKRLPLLYLWKLNQLSFWLWRMNFF